MCESGDITDVIVRYTRLYLFTFLLPSREKVKDARDAREDVPWSARDLAIVWSV